MVEEKERLIFKNGFKLPENIGKRELVTFWLMSIWPPLTADQFEKMFKATMEDECLDWGSDKEG